MKLQGALLFGSAPLIVKILPYLQPSEAAQYLALCSRIAARKLLISHRTPMISEIGEIWSNISVISTRLVLHSAEKSVTIYLNWS